jgi:plasmid stabilization system protein ParE
VALKPIEVDPAALDEAREGYRWYAAKSQRAADAFMLELEAAVDAVQTDPERFGAFMHNCRQRLLKRYLYLLVYRALADRIQIVAVAHARRRPGYWRSRMSD